MMFSSPDTLIPDPYNPLDWNRYMYARGNPIRYSDPTGHLSEDEIMNYFGVTKGEQVLKVFEKGGALEGKWGWLATLRTAEVGDTISFFSKADNTSASGSLFTGTLATKNGMYYLSSDVGSIPLTYAEKFPCNGYGVGRVVGGGPGPWGLEMRSFSISRDYVATQQYPYFKWDPDKFSLGNSMLDLTSVFASIIGGNTLTFGAKAANVGNRGGLLISAYGALNVDQTPNSIILAGGGFIPGPVGGASR